MRTLFIAGVLLSLLKQRDTRIESEGYVAAAIGEGLVYPPGGSHSRYARGAVYASPP